MRNTVIDNIRGLCMLGVIGIHIGSLALAPDNFTLYCLLEILSRYSVPTFFFISGYGLACTDANLLEGSRFDFLSFIKKRLRGAGLPYVSWSLFYILYFWLVLPRGTISLHPLHLAFLLFFGLGCYHLYFMVVLLWFYGSYPLWRVLLRAIEKYGIELGLGVLLVFQLAFNYLSIHLGVDTSSWNLLAKNFFNYRLNYLPLHYLLIFMGGMLAAAHWSELLAKLRRHGTSVCLFYAAAITWDVGSAWYDHRYNGYTLLDLANTYHQLSPQGLVYTIASLLFFCLALDWLEYRHAGSLAHRIIGTLSDYSMLIYFLHPLLLEWLTSLYNKFGIVMTVKKVSLSYVLLVLASLLGSMLLKAIFNRSQLLKLLFTGRK
jgi:surface polysaccharide O-acyltransferase-like enzyme